MDILGFLGLEQRIAQAQKESPQERYARIEFELGAAEFVGKDIKIELDGDYLAKIKYDGTATGCYFKFDNKHSSKIYASEFRKRHTPFVEFKRIYLTNPVAQAGKVFTVFVGGAFAGEIEPSTGEKIGLTDSNGSDIDPATLSSIEAVEAEIAKANTAHTLFANKLKTQTAGTAERVAAASQKVKWAIINVQKAAVFGNANVEIMGNADQMLPVEEKQYLTVEHIDLYDLYIIDQAGVNVPYTVLGVLEA